MEDGGDVKFRGSEFFGEIQEVFLASCISLRCQIFFGK